MNKKFWDGKTVHFAHVPDPHDRRNHELGLTEDAARKLALCLAKLKQTTLMVPPEVDEILTALNYVLVGDPASVAAHRQMGVRKGMEPSGG